MAYWYRKRGKDVYVFTEKDGKQKSIPRAKTKHLDAEPDHNIDAWVAQWGLKNENKPVREDNFILSDILDSHLKAYIAFLASRKKSPNTVRWHDTALRRDVLPFFLEGEHPLQDPAQWPGKSIKFYTWLIARKVPESNIIRANIALRGFYKFLSDEGLIQTGMAIRLRGPVKNHEEDVTPLKFTLSPESVLAYVQQTKSSELKLIALLGYFFSLRPQEIFSARPIDFMAGTKALELECSKVMGKASLYNRLVFNVTRQRTVKGISTPKSYSKGWVCCFNEVAARLTVQLLKERKPEADLFEIGEGLAAATANKKLYDLWKVEGLSGVTVKSLRRASIYHLGHHTGLATEPINIQKHARHKRLETTMLYLRRPGEAAAEGLELDLDA